MSGLLVKNLILFLSVLCLGCAKTPYVILMGGQSNMVGYGEVADLEEAKLLSNITYYNYGRRLGLSTTSTHLFGPEVGLSQVLLENFPKEKFILIKYATSGASLLDWAKDYDSLEASITGDPSNFGRMYDSLQLKSNEILKGIKHQKIAMLWMQGERDARIPEAGVNYYDNLERFVENIREDAGDPSMPFLMGRVNPPAKRYAALSSVRSAQENLATTGENIFLIETDDLPKLKDQVHYTSEAQLILGRRFGEQLTLIINEK